MDANGMDRLLPRHQVAPMQAMIEWDVRKRRVIWNRGEESLDGNVVDLSLDGALIEVPLESTHEVGDAITVRLGGTEGQAVIRHKREGDAGTSWLYGVQWSADKALRSAVDAGVEQLRENASAVRRDWLKQRR